jgi:hypothetical protein
MQVAEMEPIEGLVRVERGTDLAQRAGQQAGDVGLPRHRLLLHQMRPQHRAQRPPVDLRVPVDEVSPPPLDCVVEVRFGAPSSFQREIASTADGVGTARARLRVTRG